MAQCEVRDATLDDLPRLVEMGERFFQFSEFARTVSYDPDSVTHLLERLMVAADGMVLVAERDSQVVGALVATLAPLWFNSEVLVATELAWWVEPGERKGSTGLRMYWHMQDWAIERGATLVAMSDLVINGQAPAEQLYDRLGLRMVERSHVKRVN